ncbi:hypothetical protein ALFP_3131 [Alcaligenes faecalis]|nr:hypothetical protein ALFP_3131 [Alcaligenes faecalis]
MDAKYRQEKAQAIDSKAFLPYYFLLGILRVKIFLC